MKIEQKNVWLVERSIFQRAKELDVGADPIYLLGTAIRGKVES
jgi:hypothetical protein